MEEFIGKKIRVEYKQEFGWKRPIHLTFGKKKYEVEKIEGRWEEHTVVRTWWQRKHRVWYEVKLSDGNFYQLYWDRGARGMGKDWVLVKKLSNV